MTTQDTIINGIATVLGNAPPLGITTVFKDLPPNIADDQCPAVFLWARTLNETRQAGGQGAGSKDMEMTVTIGVQTLGVTANSDADGITHRNLCEAIVARLRTTLPSVVGAARGLDIFRWSRQAPLADEQGWFYITFVDTVVAAFLDA